VRNTLWQLVDKNGRLFMRLGSPQESTHTIDGKPLKVCPGEPYAVKVYAWTRHDAEADFLADLEPILGKMERLPDYMHVVAVEE